MKEPLQSSGVSGGSLLCLLAGQIHWQSSLLSPFLFKSAPVIYSVHREYKYTLSVSLRSPGHAPGR